MGKFFFFWALWHLCIWPSLPGVPLAPSTHYTIPYYATVCHKLKSLTFSPDSEVSTRKLYPQCFSGESLPKEKKKKNYRSFYLSALLPRPLLRSAAPTKLVSISYNIMDVSSIKNLLATTYYSFYNFDFYILGFFSFECDWCSMSLIFYFLCLIN